MNNLSPATEPERAAGRAPAKVWPGWLPLLAGPVGLGVTGPALVLPNVSTELGVSMTAAAALVTAFGWGISVGTPLMGGFLARRGPRVAVAGCTVLLVVGAALVLTTRWLPALVLGSAMQALAGAGFVVLAMNLAGTPLAMGLVTASVASFGAVGPWTGAQVSTALGWRATLALPLLSLLAVPVVVRAVTRVKATEPGNIGKGDPLGAALVVGLVTALVFLPHHSLHAGMATVLVAGLLGWWLRRRPDGFAPAAVLTQRVFIVASLAAFGTALVNFGIVYAVPTWLGTQTGWSTGQIGIAMLVPYLVGGLGSWPLVGAVARLRFPVLLAVLLVGGVVALAAALSNSTMLLFAAMLIGSLTAATAQGALALRAAAAAPEPVRPAAIGLFNLCYLLGAAFGPAIAAAGVS